MKKSELRMRSDRKGYIKSIGDYSNSIRISHPIIDRCREQVSDSGSLGYARHLKARIWQRITRPFFPYSLLME
jgi:hypothetical protein